MVPFHLHSLFTQETESLRLPDSTTNFPVKITFKKAKNKTKQKISHLAGVSTKYITFYYTSM